MLENSWLVVIVIQKPIQKKNFLFNCPACYKKDCTSIPRLVLNFNAEDSSGTISLTTFTDIIKQLFEKPVEELYEPNTTEHVEAFHNSTNITNKADIHAAWPSNIIIKNGVLKWVLKSISLMPIDFGNSATTGTSSASLSV